MSQNRASGRGANAICSIEQMLLELGHDSGRFQTTPDGLLYSNELLHICFMQRGGILSMEVSSRDWIAFGWDSYGRGFMTYRIIYSYDIFRIKDEISPALALKIIDILDSVKSETRGNDFCFLRPIIGDHGKVEFTKELTNSVHYHFPLNMWVPESCKSRLSRYSGVLIRVFSWIKYIGRFGEFHNINIRKRVTKPSQGKFS